MHRNIKLVYYLILCMHSHVLETNANDTVMLDCYLWPMIY